MPFLVNQPWNTADRRAFADEQFDPPLVDSTLLAEVELLTNVIIAANDSDESLTRDEVDRALGIGHHPEATPTLRA